MSNDYKLELHDITKIFPGVKALDNVTIKIKPGTVHALVGENGAGKSTLMKIINGLYKPDAGAIYIDGEEVAIRNPSMARDHGIAMIHQELSYYPELSILENYFMDDFPNSRINGFIDWKKCKTTICELFKKEGIEYTPEMLMKNCSVSDIQMLEILKAISHDAKILIMDEPTSAISKREIEFLFKKIKELRDRGICIIYISHKLEEIFQIADEITVLRDGETVTNGLISMFNEDSLIEAMIGRKLTNVYPVNVVPKGDTIFEIKNFSSEGIFKDINLNVKVGEIVGISGLVGSGRTELARAMSGVDSFTSGEIYLNKKRVEIDSIQAAIDNGIIMVSEDRKIYGIVGCRSIKENITLAQLRMSKGIFINSKKETSIVKNKVKELKIKAPSIDVFVESLSGGNQQKVVLAKWLLLKTKILILDEPTRGIDVGAKYEIYKIMQKLVKDGYAIIIISSELPELIGMADRIYVMSKGKITADIGKDSFSQDLIMKHATGKNH